MINENEESNMEESKQKLNTSGKSLIAPKVHNFLKWGEGKKAHLNLSKGSFVVEEIEQVVSPQKFGAW